MTLEEQLIEALIQKYQGDQQGMQAEYARISSLDPEEKAAAINRLAKDYKGEREGLAADIAFNEDMIQRDMPQGGVAGPSSNPFSIYMGASPLQHAAAGLEKYKGYKNRREAREGFDQSVADKTRAQSDMMASQMAEASQLRKPLTPAEQWEEEQRRRFGGMRTA